MAGAGGWRLWASSFRVLNRRAAARAMRPSGTARRMSRGTNEDLLADCITHRPPQQLLPTSLRCLPAKSRRILAHGLSCRGRPENVSESPLLLPASSSPLSPYGRGVQVNRAAAEDCDPSPIRAQRGGGGRGEKGGGGGLRTLGQPERRKREDENGERSVQQIGDQAVGVVGELAVIDGLAFLEDQEAGKGGDGVLLRENTVAVEEDRGSQRPAGEEGLDGGALLLEIDGHHLGARTPAAGERLDALDDVARARRPGGPDDH